jgi:diguanylate cyclase (GGDEF)-like protein/PAS domain S-box-containing protein
MPTIQSLVTAQMQTVSCSEFADESREQLEARLQKLQRQLSLQAATEAAAGIGHYQWNRELDRLESCSEEYASLFDMTVEEALESQSSLAKTLQLIHPDDREIYRAATSKLHDSKSLQLDFRLLLEDGSIRHMREYAVAIIDEDGVDRGSVGLLQDITRQIGYERDLEYRDEIARQTEEITDIGHFIFDEENECYSFVSEGYARIHGCSVDACMRSVSCLADDLHNIFVDDRERVAAEYRHYRQHGENCAIEYRLVRGDGSVRWVRELGYAKEMKNGRVSQTLGVMQDITDRVQREQELMFKDAMASQAEAITDIGYFMYDLVHDRHQFVSQGQARIVGMGVDEFLNKIRSSDDYLELIYEPDRERIRQIYQDTRVAMDGWRVEYRILRADGELRWLYEIGKSHKRNGDRVEQTIGVVQDVTEQKKIEQELLYKDALANQAEAITDIGHFVYDEIRQRYLYASPGLERILDMSAEDFRQSAMMDAQGKDTVHPDDRERVQKTYDRFIAGGDEWQVDYRLLRSDGEIRWVREMGKAHLVNHGIPEQTIGVLQDITAQKIAEEDIIRARDTLEQQVVERTRELANTVKQLQIEIEEREKIAAELNFLANHDALTGLPSLRLCKDRLDQSLAEARRNHQKSAVMFLDLDGFKEINDRHGHEFGDRVLKTCAERITAEIRETDTVARIGGDEFVIILSSLPESQIARRVASSLIEGISLPLRIDDIDVRVSASIGIALYPQDGVTAEELIRSADKAMYRIKHAGKNSFGFVDSP